MFQATYHTIDNIIVPGSKGFDRHDLVPCCVDSGERAGEFDLQIFYIKLPNKITCFYVHIKTRNNCCCFFGAVSHVLTLHCFACSERLFEIN